MFEGNFTNPADLTGILIIMIECLCLYGSFSQYRAKFGPRFVQSLKVF